MTATDVYCFDTSGLIDGLERYYSPDAFPALWERVDDLIEAQRLIMSEEVWIEATVRDEPAKQWCLPRKDSIVVPTDGDIAALVQEIVLTYPAWGPAGGIARTPS